MGKKSLGRGLNAIFQDKQMVDVVPEAEADISTYEVEVSLIDPNPFQPRQVFSDEEITELSETLKEHGLIQPISVRKHDGRFQLIAGERRLRASQKLGWEKITARVFTSLPDKQMMEWALIENIQRVQLNPIEEARAYDTLIQNHGYTHEDLSERLGKSRSAVTNTLRLMKLPSEVQNFISEGKLSAGHARNLLRPEVTDPLKMAVEIIEKGLNVRETEQSTKSESKKSKSSNSIKDPNITHLEQELMYKLGTQVRIVQNSKNGTLEILYTSNDDLNRIYQLILNGNEHG
jgi:ParB family transcriptional regulator, chromosome partitioning protein